MKASKRILITYKIVKKKFLDKYNPRTKRKEPNNMKVKIFMTPAKLLET